MLDQTYDALRADEPMPITPEEMVAASELVDQLLAHAPTS